MVHRSDQMVPCSDQRRCSEADQPNILKTNKTVAIKKRRYDASSSPTYFSNSKIDPRLDLWKTWGTTKASFRNLQHNWNDFSVYVFVSFVFAPLRHTISWHNTLDSDTPEWDLGNLCTKLSTVELNEKKWPRTFADFGTFNISVSLRALVTYPSSNQNNLQNN